MRINIMKKICLVLFFLLVVNSLFSVEFEEKLSEKYWLAEYYNILLEKMDRNILLDYVPRFKESPINYYEHLDEKFYWYEDPIYLQSGLLSLDVNTLSNEPIINIQEFPFIIVKTKKLNEDNYKIIVKQEYIDKKIVDSVAYYGGELSHVVNKKIEVLFFRFDGDYLYIYLDDNKTLFTTYYAYSNEEYLAIKEFIKTNNFDMAKISLPRHADGTCDYEDTSSVKINTTQNTNVSPNKTMTVAENLKLRSGEATTTQVLTVMQAGTKVKILELGKAETIDGICSNWVKVEVQPGAKDRDGKAIRTGTVGWCYGGYLE